MDIIITSSAFEEGGLIPPKYTCDGVDISPPLQWDAVPEGTKSIALISDDPDAPMGTWVHWVLFNLPPETKELPENIHPDENLPSGAVQGSSFVSGGRLNRHHRLPQNRLWRSLPPERHTQILF